MHQPNQTFAAANAKAKADYATSKQAIEAKMAQMPQGDYSDYFKANGRFLLDMMAHYEAIGQEGYFEQDFDELLKINHSLFEDITEPGYQRSFVNPTYAVGKFGEALGQSLSAIAYLFRNYVGYVYEDRLFEMNSLNELYLLTYDLVVDQGVRAQEKIGEALRDHLLAGGETQRRNDMVRSLSADFQAYSHIVDSYDLTDLRYLFRYGMYIGTNEIDQAKFLLSLPEEKIKKIADTYTEAYIRGFHRNNIPLDHKKTVQVVYHLGFERVMKEAYKNFATQGLKPFAWYHLRGVQRPRLINTRPNRQMEYDHRFSDALYLDETYVTAMLDINAKVMTEFKEAGHVFSGLALFEIFGDVPFQPVNHKANMAHDDATTALKARFTREIEQEYRKYIPGDAYSFTINDYPLPSIGKDYEAIFEATIQVNTLDEALYEGVQATMIDALDQSDYVHVMGREGNETDIKVSLCALKNPEKETKFDNCTADVNVPVGEVYTSPVLKGTEGLLHVKEVYLKGLRYKELKIWFKDGMTTDYTCKNFDTEEENRNFVRETLMHPHDTLPLGEFAIGTNTVAYMMARKFDIQSQLPILIGEKTGPHFAIGDTCFVFAEDSPVYNGNGKEIVARENEVTCLRKENPEKAYTFRHTDITIPYSELDTIIGYSGAGDAYEIIRGGRFVLPGTELLNEPLDKE